MTDSHTSRLESALAGRYKIERKLGEGGMASVFLAKDLKHERKVALKILKPELAAVIGAERFLAEIKTTANLQHPHILPLFDSGEADGFLYYVMPFIDGESLREQLDREKQLGVDEAVAIAKDVADALEYAHSQGVIHRDIKPANILLHRGRPVVADFGIAVAISAAGGGRMTETGLSLGTPHYMSPEQASADRDLSGRSDVYSLGCVLYEMIAGQPPHTGPSAQSVLVRIMTETPRSLTELRHTVPLHVASVVAKAVEKLPADRFDSAQAFADALQDPGFRYTARQVSGATTVGTAPELAAPARGARPSLAWLVGTAALAIVAAVGWFRPGGSATDASDLPVTRAVLDLGTVNKSPTTDRIEISPDGRRIALVGGDATASQRGIWVRGSEDESFRRLPGTGGAYDIDFSPDGEWLVYEANGGGLAKIRFSGGDPLPVVTADVELNGPQWGDDGWVYYTGDVGVYRVPETGGEPELVIPDAAWAENVRPLPGGSGLLVTDRSNGSTGFFAWGADSIRTVLQRGVDARYVASGHLLYAEANGLWAVPFDEDTGRTTGSATPLLNGIRVMSSYFGDYCVSDNGTLIYTRGSDMLTQSTSELRYFTPEGADELDPIPTGSLRDARWSPNGERLAYSTFGGGGGGVNIVVYDALLRTAPRVLTFEGENEVPVWSPNGESLVFLSERDGQRDLYVRSVDSDEPAQLLVSLPGEQEPMDWSEDGLILFLDGGSDDLWIADVSDPDTVVVRPWVDEAGNMWSGRISNSGDFAVYNVSEPSGTKIYARSFPEARQPTLISTDGFLPRWAPGDSAIYYFRGSGPYEIVRVDVTFDPILRVLREEVVGSVNFPIGWSAAWDLHPDGTRFASMTFAGTTGEGDDMDGPPHVIVTNWFSEMKARLGEEN